MVEILKFTVSRGFVFIVLGVLSLLVGVSCDSSTPLAEKENDAIKKVVDNRRVIVAMGDSLTAGLGVNPDENYPFLLEQLLVERGLNYRVVNAGISGETSSGAKSRVEWILKLEPAIVILETGANDGLRGIDPALVEANIEQIIVRLKQEKVTVVLAGMMMVTNLGETYVKAFNGLYPRLAAKHQVILMPFFLEDVAMDDSQNQGDGIHPNRKGYKTIVANLLPYVEEAIKRDTEELPQP